MHQLSIDTYKNLKLQIQGARKLNLIFQFPQLVQIKLRERVKKETKKILLILNLRNRIIEIPRIVITHDPLENERKDEARANKNIIKATGLDKYSLIN